MTVRAPLVPGTLSPWRQVPSQIPRPEYVGRRGPAPYHGPHVQTPETIAKMRVAGRLAAQATQLAGEHCKPGVTTDEIDRVVHEFLCDHGAYPSTLGYKGYPKSCCTSLNEVICHGIPDSTVIEDGDIINVDVTAYLDGVHGDTDATFCVGEVSEEARLLVERTREATMRGIKAVAPGRPVSVIGRVIESYAKRFGYGVVRDFGGHGISTTFHSGLFIPHYDNPSATTILEVGMTFTIEPMITLGTHTYQMWKDGWTVVTRDRRWTAQFEHTLVVTESGAEILDTAVTSTPRDQRPEPHPTAAEPDTVPAVPTEAVTAPAPRTADSVGDAAGFQPIDHHHADVSGGWLRPAVFGAMDGLVTNIALIAGVGGGGVSSRTVVLTGFAGLVAGAISMGLGEYTSVRTQNEQIAGEVAKERRELELNPHAEAEELAQMWIDRGLPPDLARQVATAVGTNPDEAVRVHAREELGIDPHDLASPWTAALSSFVCFSVGALIPLLPYLLGATELWPALAVGGLGLFAAGALTARLTSRRWWASGLRQLLLGLAAAGATYLIGSLIGVSGIG